jgi:O-antigen/teichoic acid export membrane protein
LLKRNSLSIRQLASETFWYGFSNIFGRFLNYLLTPLLTGIFASDKYGDISVLFASAAFLQVIYSFGMETSYFRFCKDHPEEKVYNNGSMLLLLLTLVLTSLLLLPVQLLADYLAIGEHPEYIQWILLIVALDNLAVLPFSKLRHTRRPRKFAVIKIVNILTNIGLVLFFLVWCKGAFEKGEPSIWASCYDPSIDIGYVILSNLCASALTVGLLWKELKALRFSVDPQLLRSIIAYAAPLLIVGFGGMINETIDRIMLTRLFPGSLDEARSANGIYSANAKLAVVITLFITAFRMGAEPFFFRQSKEKNAPETYARIMNFFVITCCICFLSVMLFLDIWKHFMGIRIHPEYLEGLKAVPLLMLGKVFLGMYYNLSIWYKLTNRNMMAAWITLAGAGITILLNALLIPLYGFMGCAIASLTCYAFMVVISYLQGQQYYPVPYNWKKSLGYLFTCVVLFGVHQWFREQSPALVYTHLAGMVLSLSFVGLLAFTERKELAAFLRR